MGQALLVQLLMIHISLLNDAWCPAAWPGAVLSCIAPGLLRFEDLQDFTDIRRASIRAFTRI